MADLKKSFTNISEVARQRLGITRDEYALCSYIAYRIADPRQRLSGWCCDTKEDIAAFVGVTRAGLYKMAERMILGGLIDVGGRVPFAWKVTAKWIDTENECKQSLHDSVNKVDTDCKQSLHKTVNKVYTHNKVELDISKSKEEEEKDAALSSTSEPENLSLEAERKKEIPPNSAAPPLDPPFTQVGTIEPAPPILARLYSPEHPDFSIVTSVPGTYTANTEFRRVNIPEEIEALKTDAAAKETFALVRKIPSNLYPDYVEAFEKEIGGTGETYHNLPAFRKHFFNWCGSRWEIAQRKATGAKATRSTIQTFRGTDYGNEKQAF